MSGGYFNYLNDNAAREIFGWDVRISYRLKDNQEDASVVAEDNPLEDREISELVYDVFCLLHSYDWYKSCDTDYECYRNDVKFFKNKWLNKTGDERIHDLVERAIKRVKKVAEEEIKQIKEVNENNRT